MSPKFSGGAPRVMLLAALAGCASSAPPRLPADAAAPPDGALALDLGTDDLPAADGEGPAACGTGGAGGQWAGWRLPDPAARKFDTSMTGVAVDPGTGLIWQRGTAPAPLDWEGAQQYCDCLALAGHDDWRLPTRIELVSLVDYRRVDPSIDLDAFPETPDTWFWSASPVAGDPLVAWYLSFMDGNTHERERDATYGVRCVRGQVPARMPYQIADATVTDPSTHLTWQRTLDGTTRTWDQASAYCGALPLAGGGWRLPSMSELQSLIDESVTEPAIDGAAFPGTPAEGFWAGTPLAGMPPARWFVSFDRGIAYNAVPDHQYNVRCVR